MDPDRTTMFFALLAIGAEVATVVIVVLLVGARWSGGLSRARDGLVATVQPHALALAAVVALVCTSGSLYLSEVAHYPPCRLCWVQRGFMYPLVPLLAVAAAVRWRAVAYLAVPMTVLGGLVSIYHLVLERRPSLESGACDPTNPCSIIWVEHFGYLTIPAMALSGFAVIAALAVLSRSRLEVS